MLDGKDEENVSDSTKRASVEAKRSDLFTGRFLSIGYGKVRSRGRSSDLKRKLVRALFKGCAREFLAGFTITHWMRKSIFCRGRWVLSGQ